MYFIKYMHIENSLILSAPKDHVFARVMHIDKDHQVDFDEVASKSTGVHKIFPHEFLKNRV